jgi:hypothetical protein
MVREGVEFWCRPAPSPEEKRQAEIGVRVQSEESRARQIREANPEVITTIDVRGKQVKKKKKERETNTHSGVECPGSFLESAQGDDAALLTYSMRTHEL